MEILEEKIVDKNLDELYEQFTKKAETLTTQVYRAENEAQVLGYLQTEIENSEAEKVVGYESGLITSLGIKDKLTTIEVESYFTNIGEEVEEADIGISELDIAVAKSSTLIEDATSYEKRLISMLPKTHVAIVRTDNLVPDLEDAFRILESEYGTKVPAYLSFITGPSKTADIERTLTIGVHGPERLVVIFVD